jgi:hypothetical protein
MINFKGKKMNVRVRRWRFSACTVLFAYYVQASQHRRAKTHFRIISILKGLAGYSKKKTRGGGNFKGIIPSILKQVFTSYFGLPPPPSSLLPLLRVLATVRAYLFLTF